MGWPFLFKLFADRSKVVERRRPQDKREGPIGRGQRSEQERPIWQKRVQRNQDVEKSPLIPSEITPEDLDMGVRVQLKTLTAENAEMVARHLAMVSLLINDDPQLAHKHALAASRRASRLAVVHETLGLTAYATGDFALALRELLTHRRLSGSNDQLPIIVDSERGMGRPERALEAVSGVDRTKLPVGVRINLAVALSGARLDLGQAKLAKQELEIKELSPKQVFEQSPLLFRSYAEVLRELGDDGSEWDTLADRAERAISEAAGEVFDLVEEITIPTSEDFERKPRREYKPRESSDSRGDREGGYKKRESSDRTSGRPASRGDRPYVKRDGDRSFTPRGTAERYERKSREGSDTPRPRAERSERPTDDAKAYRGRAEGDKAANRERYFGKGDGTNRSASPRPRSPGSESPARPSRASDRKPTTRDGAPRPPSDRKFVKRDSGKPTGGRRPGSSPRGGRGKAS